jgi:hypothetical protein
MSRGPGVWQRGILAALTMHPAVYLCDLLPAQKTRAQYSALHRAAYALQEAGRLEVWACEPIGSTPTVILARPGYDVRSYADVPRVKCGVEVDSRDRVNA